MLPLWKLLAALALLLMPFGMTGGAMAQHGVAKEMTSARHCPDDRGANPAIGFSECTVACAATLPSPHLISELRWAVSSAPIADEVPARPPEHQPQIATPPPRLS